MRAMGAAEAQVDRLSDCIKRRGQSWRLYGLKAIMQLMCRRFEGRLAEVVKRIAKATDKAHKPLLDGIANAHKAARKALEEKSGAGVPQAP